MGNKLANSIQIQYMVTIRNSKYTQLVIELVNKSLELFNLILTIELSYCTDNDIVFGNRSFCFENIYYVHTVRNA